MNQKPIFVLLAQGKFGLFSVSMNGEIRPERNCHGTK
jgi:hypothetical protein